VGGPERGPRDPDHDRAVDQFGQVIDVMLSERRDALAARKFFHAALVYAARPVEVTADRAAVYPALLDELQPGAFHNFEKYANNLVEADHGRLKARLRPMRGLKVDRNAAVIAAGHAFIQNLRRGQHELGVEAAPKQRRIDAFDELDLVV
jgi:transposase, IS6 family